MKILIVDDDEESKSILHGFLKPLNGEILEAADGAEGFEVALSQRPDLIISDALMPNVDGFHFLREVRRSPELSNTPFIFYSAVYTGIKEEELARSLGADAFMAKPLEADEFLKQLKQLIGRLDKTKKKPVSELLENKEKYLGEYSLVVATRLEAKVQELKLANRALRESEQKFRLLADYTYDWEYWLNPEGNYIYLSPSCERTTGYRPDEFMSNPKLLFDLVNPAYAEAVHQHYTDENNEKSPHYSMEFPITTKAGEERWLEHHCSPIFDEQGNYAGRRGNNRDITERKQADAKRLELETQLGQKHKIEALGMMAGGMAHNFNNNLSIILGGIDLTRIKLPGNSEVMPLLDNAKIAVLRSRDLIQNILSYSRQGVLNKEPIQMALVVDETLKLLRSTIPTTVKIHYQPDAECHDLTIQADSTRIQEALINLCNNAIQAMDERGELTISLTSLDLQPKDIPAQYQCFPGAYLQLSVQDSGCGMTDDLVEKIFDPFFTTKAVDKGTGMGLATLQGMVLQHGGLIKVKSSPGQGSTFELYFPLSDTAQPTPIIINPALPRGSEKIIFLDDNEMLANLGETMLSELGYQVCTMYSSTETLKLFQANPDHFDLLISDQTMPDMTGQELIQKLRKIRPNLAAILCTGYSSKVDEDIAKKFEINAFLMKPLDLVKLAQTVRNVLDGVEIEYIAVGHHSS